MPNYTKTGLKIGGNRCYEVMNPPQNPDLQILEADNGAKGSKHSKKSFGKFFKKSREVILKTTSF